jgi:hypothetical protein
LDIAALFRKAALGGMGSTKAAEKLAEISKSNPEAKAAFDRLGIDVPPDVLSDNATVQSTAGLVRSQPASAAESAWRNTIQKASEKADEAMSELDGSTDLAEVSEKVKSSLDKTHADLKSAEEVAHNKVTEMVPKGFKSTMDNTANLLNKRMEEVGYDGLSSDEKKLMSLATDPNGVLYGRIVQERRHVGDALGGKTTLYGNTATGELKQYYGALAEDQKSAVMNLGDQSAVDALQSANRITQIKKGLEKRIVEAYGKEGDGSIATTLKGALISGAEGNITKLRKVIKAVPSELRKEAIASSLMANVRSKSNGSGIGGMFGFSEYAKLYQGLRRNSPVYAAITKELGPESSELLRSLYVVSKRMTDSRPMVLPTGKSAYVQALTADNLITKVCNNAAGKITSVVAGSVAGGPVGGAAATAITHLISSGKKDVVKSVGEFINSPEFARAVENASAANKNKLGQ